MVRALREHGVDARIVSSDDDVGGRLGVVRDRWVDHEGVPTYFIPRIRSRSHTLVGFTFSPGFIPWLWREIPRQDFVHVHTVFSFPANTAMAIARRRSKPYAVRPLGQLCSWSLEVRSPIKRLQLAAMGRRNIDGATFLHATSQMEADEVGRLNFRCPIKVLPLGLRIPDQAADRSNILRAELNIPAGNRIALFLSRIHVKKGLDTLLRALGHSSTANINLVVCGDGEKKYVAELKRLANQLGIASRVHWLGFVRGERKWEIARGSDFFVLPSYSENFGIAVLEALACGLFVIVSPHVGISEELAQAGFARLAPVEPMALAEAIASVSIGERFDDDARRTRRAFIADRFSWDAAAHRLIAEYTKALHTLPSSPCAHPRLD